ncbi:MAG: ATP-dependent Clp protease adaptor ClpS [Chloroflexota bacterium]
MPTETAAPAPTLPATLPREDEEQEQRSKPRALDPYKVILHNDDHNSMDHVVRSLTRSVPGLGLRKAFKIMMEAHETGKAVVIVCPLEHAELYRDRLISCGLTATVEAA